MTFTDYVFEKTYNSENTAVIYKRPFSYKEIYGNINYVTKLLMEKDYSKKDSVLIVSENSIFFIETYFGIIKNGSVCVPINPVTSEGDIKYIMDILKINMVFVQEKYKKKIKSIVSNEVEIYTENYFEGLECTENLNLNNTIDVKEDVALIMFTSGSTAKPKGVMLTHYNLMYNTDSIIEYLNLVEKDRIEVVLPFYYCYGTSL